MSLSLMEHGIKPGALIDVFLLRSLGINSSFCFALFIREIDLYIGRFFCCSVRLSTSRTSQSHLRRQIGEGKVTTAEATLLLLQVELFPLSEYSVLWLTFVLFTWFTTSFMKVLNYFFDLIVCKFRSLAKIRQSLRSCGNACNCELKQLIESLGE
jgi:hypothetical protein